MRSSRQIHAENIVHRAVAVEKINAAVVCGEGELTEWAGLEKALKFELRRRRTPVDITEID